MKVLAVISGASVRTLAAFSRQFGTSFTVLADPGRIVRGSRYRLKGNPTVVIIDKEGMVRYAGGFTPAQMIKKNLESMRNAPGS